MFWISLARAPRSLFVRVSLSSGVSPSSRIPGLWKLRTVHGEKQKNSGRTRPAVDYITVAAYIRTC